MRVQNVITFQLYCLHYVMAALIDFWSSDKGACVCVWMCFIIRLCGSFTAFWCVSFYNLYNQLKRINETICPSKWTWPEVLEEGGNCKRISIASKRPHRCVVRTTIGCAKLRNYINAIVNKASCDAADWTEGTTHEKRTAMHNKSALQPVL